MDLTIYLPSQASTVDSFALIYKRLVYKYLNQSSLELKKVKGLQYMILKAFRKFG